VKQADLLIHDAHLATDRHEEMRRGRAVRRRRNGRRRRAEVLYHVGERRVEHLLSGALVRVIDLYEPVAQLLAQAMGMHAARFEHKLAAVAVWRVLRQHELLRELKRAALHEEVASIARRDARCLTVFTHVVVVIDDGLR
jgi:hypothetical protein